MAEKNNLRKGLDFQKGKYLIEIYKNNYEYRIDYKYYLNFK